MKTIKGPAIFLAQYLSDESPFDRIDTAAEWASSLGFKAMQIPSWDGRCFDLEQAASSQSWCDDWMAKLDAHGMQASELSTHLQGQLVAVHPSADEMFDGFAPAEVRNNPKARTEWAIEQIKLALRASANLGLDAMATFSGALVWPFMYPWPPRPHGLVDEAFAELAKRWRPILDVADECGVDVCFEIHPGEDLHDGVTWEKFLNEVNDHPRANILYDPSHFVLQCLDHVQFIDIYHERIKMFHVKDAEFRPDGRCGVYGGYQDWCDRPGRFRSTGDGQVDWVQVFTKMAKYDFPGWAVLEWECAFKDNLVGAREGAEFIKNNIIEVASGSFDDFADTERDSQANRRMLGLE